MSAQSDSGDTPTRVVLRPYASPLPLGLLAFSVGMLLLAGQGLGWIPSSQSASYAVLLATFVTPVQLLSAVFALLDRDTGAAAVLGLFSTSWLALGLTTLVAGPSVPNVPVGLFLLGFALVVLVPGVLLFGAKILLGVVVTLSAIRAALQGVAELTADTLWLRIASLIALIIVALGVYLAAAFLVEDLKPGTPLPLARVRGGRQAVRARSTEQPEDLAAEPGVREQL